MDFANITTHPVTYDTWRVDAPLSDSRIMAMANGEPVSLILWPNSKPGTRYVIERTGAYYLTLTERRDTADGKQQWTFLDHNGSTWHALTKRDHTAHVATLTRKALINVT